MTSRQDLRFSLKDNTSVALNITVEALFTLGCGSGVLIGLLKLYRDQLEWMISKTQLSRRTSVLLLRALNHLRAHLVSLLFLSAVEVRWSVLSEALVEVHAF